MQNSSALVQFLQPIFATAGSGLAFVIDRSAGFTLPTWGKVVRDYDPGPREHLVIGTAGRSVEECFETIRKSLENNVGSSGGRGESKEEYQWQRFDWRTIFWACTAWQ